MFKIRDVVYELKMWCLNRRCGVRIGDVVFKIRDVVSELEIWCLNVVSRLVRNADEPVV